MAASLFVEYTKKRAFTEKYHDEIINEKKMFFHHIMSSPKWNVFLNGEKEIKI